MDVAAEAMRWDDLIRPDRVHRSLYVSPTIFRAEMEHLFGATWVYLAHESQIPDPDTFVTARLGLRPVIVTRDSDGELHVLFNRCSHRAATVCRSDQGSAKRFQCPYHGWSFKNTGELIGAPWPKGYGPDFDKASLGLGTVARVESYRGFIFATLATDAPDLVTHLAGATSWLNYWIDRAPTAEVRLDSRANRMTYRGNWKLAYDNAGDGYHPSFSHRSLLEMAGRGGDAKDMTYFGRNPDDGPMRLVALGNGHTVIDQRANYDKPGDIWANQRPQPGREFYESRIRDEHPENAEALLDLAAGSQINLNIFPNLLIIGNQVQVVEPLAVDRTQLTWWGTTIGDVPDDVNTLRMRTQEDFPSFGEPDDQANFEAAQHGLDVAEMEWVMINRGYGVDGWAVPQDDGTVVTRVTDELHMREYYAVYRQVMGEAAR